ncbi:hypothetical protein D9M68_335240 [compost metagenome]
MSSMRSASSSTSTSTASRRRLPASRCSSSRPGVPISTSGSLRIIAACTLKSSPPVTSPALRKVNWAKASTCLRVCCASSRVGSRISARVRTFGLASPSRRCSIGSTKAAVLPLPVCAITRRSRPSRAGGMAAAWTGVGSAKLSSATALSRRSCRANWANTENLGANRSKELHRVPQNAVPLGLPPTCSAAIHFSDTAHCQIAQLRQIFDLRWETFLTCGGRPTSSLQAAPTQGSPLPEIPA